MCHLITNEQIHQDITNFWEIEHNIQGFFDIDCCDSCETHFKNTYIFFRRWEQHVVAIPFKGDRKNLEDSSQQGERRHFNLELKLKIRSKIRDQYTVFMEEYVSLDVMTIFSDFLRWDIGFGYYLLHRVVTETNSTTTKLRLVFDGSTKASSGLLLNDIQHVGPVMQYDLMSILLRFRKYRDCEDVSKQVEVH